MMYGETRLLLSENTKEITFTPRKKVYYTVSQTAQAESVVAASE